jgi:hypothetical protein
VVLAARTAVGAEESDTRALALIDNRCTGGGLEGGNYGDVFALVGAVCRAADLVDKIQDDHLQ